MPAFALPPVPPLPAPLATLARFLGLTRQRMPVAYVVDWTPTSVAGGTTADEAVTVAGVVPGSAIVASAPGLEAGVAVAGARATAPDEITVTFVNATGGSLSPPAGNWIFAEIRHG